MDITPQEYLLYIGIVVVVLIVGLFLYRKEIRFLFKRKEAKGMIINWMATNEKGVKYFYPMIKFETPNYGEITFRADDRCVGKPLFDPGTVVVVRYLDTDIEYRKVIYP